MSGLSYVQNKRIIYVSIYRCYARVPMIQYTDGTHNRPPLLRTMPWQIYYYIVHFTYEMQVYDAI